MALDLERIQSMWEKDSKIDIDNLHTESLKIPSLHAKYFDLYNNIVLLRKNSEQQKRKIKHERHQFYSGKADPDVYIDEPFQKKVRDKNDMERYLNADNKLSRVSLKVEYYDVMLKYLEDILKQIHNRTYQIKNSIEFMRFQSGLG